MRASERIGEQLRDSLLRLGVTPFARALASGTVAFNRYVDYMCALHHIGIRWRSAWAGSGAPPSSGLGLVFADWVALVEAELHTLAPRTQVERARVRRAALDFSKVTQQCARRAPAGLVGVAYLLFESYRSSRPAARRLREEDAPLSPAAVSSRDLDWEQAGAAIDDALPDERATKEAAIAAQDACELLRNVYMALMASAEVENLSDINPEAGAHHIPRDPEVLGIALSVADQMTGRYEYLTFRYGERGARFARSDGAWMATLCTISPAAALGQVDWLAGLLSARGIPSVVVERHLQLLHETLTEPSAPKAAGVETLQLLVRHLAERRLAAFSAPALAALAAAEVAPLGRGSGEVLVGAVADQRAGTGACADNIRAWAMRDPRLAGAASERIVRFLDDAARAATA